MKIVETCGVCHSIDIFRAGNTCYCHRCHVERPVRVRYIKTTHEEHVYALRARMRNC